MGADRFAAVSMGRGIAEAAELGSHGIDDVEVQIQGFPFVTQLVAGSLDEVTGTAGRVSFGGYEVLDLRFEARRVSSRAPWAAGQVRADGVVAFDTLAAVLSERARTPVTVAVAPEVAEGLVVGLAPQVRGVPVDVRAVVEPSVVDGVVSLQVTQVSLGGTSVAVEALPTELGGLLGGGLPTLDLGDDVRVTEVSVEAEGLRVALEARDVALGNLSR